MKKKFTALFLAAICLITPLTAQAADAGTNVTTALTITTDTFTYTAANLPGQPFKLESELAAPDYMVVGVLESETEPGVPDEYIITPINMTNSSATGMLSAHAVAESLGDQQLQVGDLLQRNGFWLVSEGNPLGYLPDAGQIIYLGNGVDVFGEEFERVVRLQLVIDQEAVSNWPYYDIDILHGDVNVDDEMNVLDCIVLNRHLLGGASLCDYAKLAADINENGAPDGDDALSIMKEIVGLTENFE